MINAVRPLRFVRVHTPPDGYMHMAGFAVAVYEAACDCGRVAGATVPFDRNASAPDSVEIKAQARRQLLATFRKDHPAQGDHMSHALKSSPRIVANLKALGIDTAKMRNLRMAEKLESGEALPIDAIGNLDPKTGEWIVTGMTPSALEDSALDLCVAATEQWIWSVGVNDAGEVRASTTAAFYQARGWRCIWLR